MPEGLSCRHVAVGHRSCLLFAGHERLARKATVQGQVSVYIIDSQVGHDFLAMPPGRIYFTGLYGKRGHSTNAGPRHSKLALLCLLRYRPHRIGIMKLLPWLLLTAVPAAASNKRQATRIVGINIRITAIALEDADRYVEVGPDAANLDLTTSAADADTFILQDGTGHLLVDIGYEYEQFGSGTAIIVLPIAAATLCVPNPILHSLTY